MTDEPATIAAPPPANVPAPTASATNIYAPSTRIGAPSKRPLKIYAFDPSRGRRVGNMMSVAIDYERLAPGPIGSRFAVIDYDGATRKFYLPVDLDDPMVLARGGLEPSETDPRFHQQMVYAIASETLERFQKALGRRVHWRRPTDEDGKPIRGKPNRLTIYPHAMRQANAFYSPGAHAILFGYFAADSEDYGENLPGQTIFTCLSHDIVAHEVTHAIVDGIRLHFMEPTNIDVPAFHEAFADLTALFQHFTHKEVLLDTLQKTGGKLHALNLETDHAARSAGSAANMVNEDGSLKPAAMIQRDIAQQNPLIALASQFGQATGVHGGLRSALGVPPTPDAIAKTTEPHERGSILVAAVFDAYFTVYLNKASSLLALAPGNGALPDALAELLANSAAKMADTFFALCARALDYCPPVDLTFGDFLRALMTADLDYYPDDTDGIRDALMQAFRLRGIVADGASYFSEKSLCWPELQPDALPPLRGLKFGDPNGLTRAEQNHNGDLLREWAFENAAALGFTEKAAGDYAKDTDKYEIDVPSFHPMFRVAQSGELKIDMVVELVQTRTASLYPGAENSTMSSFLARSGVTLIIAKPSIVNGQRRQPYVRYAIAKHLTPERLDRQRASLAASPVARHAPDGHFAIDFALLHQG